jgi:hypothetical protein
MGLNGRLGMLPKLKLCDVVEYGWLGTLYYGIKTHWFNTIIIWVRYYHNRFAR